jgi:cysteine synthase A
MAPVLSSVLDAIGATPLVELRRLHPGPGRILAKLDYLNPGGSKKDRIALRMVEDATADGRLGPGQTVVELTSGNTGTGLAIVCAVTGHPFVAVMSRGNSDERAAMMRALGAEVVLVDQAPGAERGHVSGDDLARVEEMAAALTIERGAFRADQFRLEGNARAHEDGTGQELWQQSGGDIDAFCEFIGTGGTLAGVARALKGHRPEIACYAVDPSRPDHRIQGGGYSMPALPLLHPDLVDGRLTVTDDDAIATARRLARVEGIFAGFSAGANVAAAERLLAGPHRGQSVAVVLADSGLKYLSTDLWG